MLHGSRSPDVQVSCWPDNFCIFMRHNSVIVLAIELSFYVCTGESFSFIMMLKYGRYLEDLNKFTFCGKTIVFCQFGSSIPSNTKRTVPPLPCALHLCSTLILSYRWLTDLRAWMYFWCVIMPFFLVCCGCDTSYIVLVHIHVKPPYLHFRGVAGIHGGCG